MVSEFKMLAYINHNPTIREEFAKKWLLAKGLSCNHTQLKIIQISAPAWLGTALSTEVSIIIDDLHESKFAGDATKLIEHYTPAIKNYAPTVESFSNPQARAPIVSAAAGGVVMGGVIALNNNPGNGEEEDKSKKNLQRFPPESRSVISRYFDELRGDKECPPFMKPQEENCVSVRANRFWKIGEPLDGQSLTSEIPLKIREKLGNPPANHKYIQINEDILLINVNTNVVSDMILDLGGIRVKKAQPQSGPKPNK